MKVLRKTKTAEILLQLYEGPKYIRELISEVGGSAQTVETRVQELLKEGLIVEEEWEVWPYRKMLKLTERGKDVAKILKVEESLFGISKKVAIKDAKERGKWLLALLHVMGGKISGSTRLQKLVFLLKREKGIEAPYTFSPYMYGPHSPDIIDDVTILELAGYIKIQNEVPEQPLAGDYLITREYELTPEGAKVAQEIYEILTDEQKAALSSLKQFKDMPLTELLKYVYTKYPAESRGI